MNFILISLAVAAISITISKTAVFKPLRDNVPGKWLRKLLHCPFCLSYYFSFAVALYTFPWNIDLFINTLAIVACSAIFALPILLYLELLDSNEDI